MAGATDDLDRALRGGNSAYAGCPKDKGAAMDAISQFKELQKQTWAGFAVLENFTGTCAPRLVRFAGIDRGTTVLDVGCGTGVVALTAARAGAKVTGVDLTPELVRHARENASLARLEIEWHEGDAEALPFADGTFDAVVSQFGHMFAPRPEVAVREMLRVLRRGGTIAFSTWPPELYTGRMFAMLGTYALTPPPPGVSPPLAWGDPHVVRERLGSAVKDLVFDRDTLWSPALTPQHARLFGERNLPPMMKLVQALESSDPAKLAQLRTEWEELISLYFKDNLLRQDYLLSRAVKC